VPHNHEQHRNAFEYINGKDTLMRCVMHRVD